MHDAESRRFVIRDRNWHPKALTPDYKTSRAALAEARHW